jgi:hypothetical protein
MERYFSTGQSPQQVVAPSEEEEVDLCVVADILEELAASNLRVFQEKQAERKKWILRAQMGRTGWAIGVASQWKV